MPKSSFPTERKIRLTNASTERQIQEILDQGKYKSVNAIINAALELGLPALKDEQLDVSTADSIVSRITSAIALSTDRLLLGQKKILILQTIQEEMIASIIQELEFFCKTNGISFDDALLEKFQRTLPQRFEKDKVALISKINLE